MEKQIMNKIEFLLAKYPKLVSLERNSDLKLEFKMYYEFRHYIQSKHENLFRFITDIDLTQMTVKEYKEILKVQKYCKEYVSL